MMVAAIVSVIGFSALGIARVGLRRAGLANDATAARAVARSAIEDALTRIGNDPAWRTVYAHGAENPGTPVVCGPGAFTWKLLDDDGNLADDSTDSVWLHGIGRVGDAVFVEKVRLIPNGPALTSLETSLHANGNVVIATTVQFTTDQIISSNGNVSASALLASIDGSAEAAGTASGSVTGTKTSGVPTRRLPGSGVFDYYLANGTWIDVGLLPDPLLGSPTIENVVLAPGVNPYGTGTNAEGIYVVDCAGTNVTIRNCRIVGTLVLLNPGSGAQVNGSVHWDRAVGNYPVLLVDGGIDFRYGTANLNETSVNFNPAAVPYEGAYDSDTADSYPSRIKGLVYVRGTLGCPLLEPTSRVDGVVVCEDVDCFSPLELRYRDTYLLYPPPGFRDGPAMTIAPGTWQRDVVTP